VFPGGRKVTADSADGFRARYRSDAFKKTYAFNEKGEIIPVDSYTDEHYTHPLSYRESN
jgi:hypothetical protein